MEGSTTSPTTRKDTSALQGTWHGLWSSSDTWTIREFEEPFSGSSGTRQRGGGWDCFHRSGTLDSWEPLSAFAVYPREKWTRSMKHAVERGAEFFLERQLHRQQSRYEPWYRFHYPVHYYYDLLVGLDFMTDLGHSKDKRLGYATSLLRKKRRADGRWNLDAINPEAESPRESGTRVTRMRLRSRSPLKTLANRAR